MVKHTLDHSCFDVVGTRILTPPIFPTRMSGQSSALTLRQLRIWRGLPLDDLAKVSGVRQPRLSQIEIGRSYAMAREWKRSTSQLPGWLRLGIGLDSDQMKKLAICKW
jgi:hypothetical protein